MDGDLHSLTSRYAARSIEYKKEYKKEILCF